VASLAWPCSIPLAAELKIRAALPPELGLPTLFFKVPVRRHRGAAGRSSLILGSKHDRLRGIGSIVMEYATRVTIFLPWERVGREMPVLHSPDG
jgi:hypothetical protein